MSLTKEQECWLIERKKGIGGSEIATLYGISKYNTIQDLYDDKTTTELKELDSEPAFWGKTLEKTIFDVLMKKLDDEEYFNGNISLTTHFEDEPLAVMSAGTKGILRYSPDGTLITKSGARYLIEIKTCNAFKEKEWRNNQVPPEYELQVQHGMNVMNIKECIIGCLVGGQKLIIRKVKADPKLQNDIENKVYSFWERYIVPKKRPTDDEIPTTPKKELNVEEIKIDINLVNEAIHDIKELKQSKKDVESDIKKRELIIKNYLDYHNKTVILDDEGEELVTYKSVTSNRFDSKGFKKEHKDLYNEFIKTSNSKRLLIK